MKQIRQQPMFRFLVALTISNAVGFQTWRTLFDNFAVRVAGLDGGGVGLIQSVREIPGLLTMLIIFVLLVLREHRLTALSVLCLGIGVAGTGLFPSLSGLLFTSVLMSFGYHYHQVTSSSLTLQYFDKETSPWVFGKLRSLSAGSNIGVGIVIFFLAGVMSYTQIYLLIGLAIAFVGIWGLFQDPTDTDRVPQRKKIVLRKKYWLFYFLTFMGGSRRQIFVVFSVFMLVKKFDFTVQEITILFVLNNLINYFLSPQIGKWIIRYSERKVLSVAYASLIVVFLAYAVVESGKVAGFLYILDHVFFNFNIAIRTYFQKVGDPRDIAPTMAVGNAMSHIAAVFLPVLGGMLWLVDYRIPFIGGAVMSAVSLAAAQWIKVSREEQSV